MTTMKENPVSLFEHAKAEIDKQGLGDEFVGQSALELVAVFERQGHDFTSANETLRLFSAVIDWKTVTEGAPVDESGQQWAEVLLGTNVRLGYTVRVKLNAYEEHMGERHNGKVGDLVGTRNGLCIIRYEDGSEFQHEAYNVEVLLPR